jgi:phage terminase small subunit
MTTRKPAAKKTAKKSAPRVGNGQTEMKRAFAKAIVAGKNQKDAFFEARPESKASDASAKQVGCRLAKDPLVRKTVAELQHEVDEKFTISIAAILQETLRLALADPSRIVGDKDGKKIVLLPHELDADTRAAIASFEIDDLGRIKYKFHDKNSALERLFKHRGLFKEDNNQKPPTIIERIELVALEPMPSTTKEPKT